MTQPKHHTNLNKKTPCKTRTKIIRSLITTWKYEFQQVSTQDGEKVALNPTKKYSSYTAAYRKF